jgi:hypothetical protein
VDWLWEKVRISLHEVLNKPVSTNRRKKTPEMQGDRIHQRRRKRKKSGRCWTNCIGRNSTHPVEALEEEVADSIKRHRKERDESGHASVVRNGSARVREITMGSGAVKVCGPAKLMTTESSTESGNG